MISSQLAPAKGSGGIGTLVELLASALVSHGHRVTVFTVLTSVPNVANFEVVGVPVRRSSWLRNGVARATGLVPAMLALDRSTALVDAFEQRNAIERFDVVEAQLFGAEAFAYNVRCAVPLVVRLETPSAVVARETSGQSSRAMTWMEGHALRKARRLAALSSGVAATVRELYGNKIADVDICPPGLNATKSPRSLSKTRDVSILFVGRLEPRKGASIFIDALRDVLRSNDRVAVNVVGADSPTAPNGLTHQEYARRVLGPLSARVRFHGYVSVTDLASFWAAADIFVAPSTYESFGLVYLEAMRHGIPIVAAAVPGVDEVVDPSCGVLVPPRDAQRLAAAILNLVHDPNRRSVLGQGASDRLRRHFSEDRMVQTTIDTYRRAIGEE